MMHQCNFCKGGKAKTLVISGPSETRRDYGAVLLWGWTIAPCPHIISGIVYTLFESENERQKIEPVPIPLSRASRNFPDFKTRNEKKIHNWTSEIIPFIPFGMQMDGT